MLCSGAAPTRERPWCVSTLGHVTREQADGEHDAVLRREAGTEDREWHERYGHPDGDRGDQPRDAADLALEWAGLCLDALGESGDPSELGVHAGREHDRVRLAPGSAGAAEDEIACGQAWHV
jgi:hypothetical protein